MQRPALGPDKGRQRPRGRDGAHGQLIDSGSIPVEVAPIRGVPAAGTRETKGGNVRLFGRILGWLFIGAALASLAYDLNRLAGGEAFTLSPLGQVWFTLDPASLNLLQAIVERYIWAPLWGPPGIANLLLLPAVVVFLVPGLILLLLSYRRPGPRRWFRRS